MSAYSELNAIFPGSQFTQKKEDLLAFGKDWSIAYPANPSAVVFPESTEQVVKLVQWARKNKIALVPSGGRTGLSCAATASNQEVVVAFDRMNKILEFDETDLVARIEPGVITEQLQNFAKDKGYFYPVDFGAKGSAQLGGNVATNAGGVKVVKYGHTRNWITGMTVVTGTGEVMRLNKSLKKNATGYDFRHLFIGSEGTLGFITELEVQFTNPPSSPRVLMLGMHKLEDTLAVFRKFQKQFSLTACEFFSQQALEKVLHHHSKLSAPFAEPTPYYLLLEIEEISPDTSEKMEAAFSDCFEQGWITDGVISQNSQQSENFWHLREFISESLSFYTPYKNDISVRVSQVPEFVTKTQALINQKYPNFEVIWFGHIGDGNVHINILKPKDMDKAEFIKTCQAQDDALYSIIGDFNGAISAEHGVGIIKKKYLHYSRSEGEIQMMKNVKKLFDPDNILNPGKIF